MSDQASDNDEKYSYDSRGGVLRILASNLRAVLYLDSAAEMADNFGISRAEVDEVARPVSQQLRGEESSEPAVGVRDLSVLIAQEVGVEVTDEAPYVGFGRSAEYVSGHNLARVAEHEGVSLDETAIDRRGYWPPEGDD